MSVEKDEAFEVVKETVEKLEPVVAQIVSPSTPTTPSSGLSTPSYHNNYQRGEGRRSGFEGGRGGGRQRNDSDVYNEPFSPRGGNLEFDHHLLTCVTNMTTYFSIQHKEIVLISRKEEVEEATNR